MVIGVVFLIVRLIIITLIPRNMVTTTTASASSIKISTPTPTFISLIGDFLITIHDSAQLQGDMQLTKNIWW